MVFLAWLAAQFQNQFSTLKSIRDYIMGHGAGLGAVAATAAIGTAVAGTAGQHLVASSVRSLPSVQGIISGASGQGTSAAAAVTSSHAFSNTAVVLYILNADGLCSVVLALITLRVSILVYRFVKSWVPSIVPIPLP